MALCTTDSSERTEGQARKKDTVEGVLQGRNIRWFQDRFDPGSEGKIADDGTPGLHTVVDFVRVRAKDGERRICVSESVMSGSLFEEREFVDVKYQ